MSKAKVIIILVTILLLTPIASGCAKNPPVVLEESFWLEPQPQEEVGSENLLSELYGSGSSEYGYYCSKLFFLESRKPVEIIVRQRIPESRAQCLDGVLLRGKSYGESSDYWDIGAMRRVGDYWEYLLVFTPFDSDYYCLFQSILIEK